MKHSTAHWLFLAALCFGPVSAALCTSSAVRASDQQEIAIEKVFVPLNAYDDNQTVMIRAEGRLPDPCYVLGMSEVRVLPARVVEIHQYAWRRDDGVCSTRDDLPETPFSEDVPLGRLSAGEYKIIEHPSEGAETFRIFNVAKAAIGTRDDLRFADVTQISIPDVAVDGQDARARVSGILASSCDTISDLQIERQNDVILLRPVERSIAQTVGEQKGGCAYVLKSFSLEVDLGRLPPGEYMVLVHGGNGHVVQQTFHVFNE
jgi:hypothetical protein